MAQVWKFYEVFPFIPSMTWLLYVTLVCLEVWSPCTKPGGRVRRVRSFTRRICSSCARGDMWGQSPGSSEMGISESWGPRKLSGLSLRTITKKLRECGDPEVWDIIPSPFWKQPTNGPTYWCHKPRRMAKIRTRRPGWPQFCHKYGSETRGYPQKMVIFIEHRTYDDEWFEWLVSGTNFSDNMWTNYMY